MISVGSRDAPEAAPGESAEDGPQAEREADEQRHGFRGTSVGAYPSALRC